MNSSRMPGRARWRSGLRAFTATLGVAAAVSVLGFVNSPAASAGEWSNNAVTFSIDTGGRFVGRIDTSVWTGLHSELGRTIVKTHIWSTNGQIDLWTKEESVDTWRTYRDYKVINQDVPPGTRICVEGFQGSTSVGLPCVTVTDDN